jgi:hypothetical protein
MEIRRTENVLVKIEFSWLWKDNMKKEQLTNLSVETKRKWTRVGRITRKKNGPREIIKLILQKLKVINGA